VRNLWLTILVLGAAGLLAAIPIALYLMARGAASDADEAGPPWPAGPARVDLTGLGFEVAQLELSQDGRHVCAWGWLPPLIGDYQRDPGRAAVFDLAGRAVQEALDQDGRLTGTFFDLFPATAWRVAYADFVKKAGGWGFTANLDWGVRLVEPREPNLFGGRPASLTDAAPRNWTVELWRLRPERVRLWATRPLPDAVQGLETVGFFERGGVPLILLAFGGREAAILSRADGSLVEMFTYGHIETDDEAVAYKRKFGLDLSDGDPALRFTTHAMAFEPSRRWVACGAFWGRRVRVVSADPPHETVFEAHGGDSPWQPAGGVWRVQRVEFAAGGRYLIAEYHFGGRGTLLVMEPTEIYDTRTWQIVWQEESLSISDVSLSPDGQTLAFRRSSVLEIGRFAPSGPPGAVQISERETP
jgi:hypothetical protein